MKYLFTLCLLIVSLSGISQWQQTGSRVRYVNGLGIPTKDTAAGVAADSSQILIRPADSALYVKYKRTWLRVGGGGGSIAGSGTTNYIPKFTSSTAIGNSQIFDNGTSVGIGTTSPNALLHLNSSTSAFLRLQTTNGAGKIWGIGADNAYSNGLNFSEIGVADGRLFIASGGNVGIGTTSPTGKLEVRGLQSASKNLLLNLSKFDYGVTYFYQNYSNTFFTNGKSLEIELDGLPMLQLAVNNAATTGNAIFPNGNVGIGTTSPAGRFVVADGQTLLGTNTNNGVDRLQVSGSVNVSGNVGIGTLSAATLSMQVEKDVNNDHVTSLKNRNSGSAATTYLTLANDANLGLGFGINSTTASGTFWGFSRSNLVSNEVLNFNSNWIFNLGNSIGSIAFGLNSNEAFRIPQSRRILFNTTTDNGTDRLQVNGSIQGTGFNQAYTARTTTYTAATTDYFIDCTSGTFTVNLFTAVGNTGRILIIKNSGTGTITVDPNGSQTIDGATTQTLSTQWSRVHIISDGANWKIISN